MNKALIISGGHVNHDLLLNVLKNKYDYLVAVDGGMNPLWVINVSPDIMVGDFDSCNSHALNIFRAYGIKELQFDVKKDMTDTDLAIEHLIDLGISRADILGATGTRMDHTLANMMIMFKYEDRIELTMIDQTNRMFVGQKGMVIDNAGYAYISLLPISDVVEGVTFEGVAYPLDQYNLQRESSYAISNEILDSTCRLTFKSGKLLVIQSMD